MQHPHLDTTENTLDNCAIRPYILELEMNTRRLRVALRQFRNNQIELQKFWLGLAGESKDERRSQENIESAYRSRVAIAAVDELLAFLLRNQTEPTSVSQAVDEILRTEGATKYSDIVTRVREDYPEIVENINDLDNTVFAALDYWIKAGKFRRVERGVYERIGERERRRLKRKRKETVPSKT